MRPFLVIVALLIALVIAIAATWFLFGGKADFMNRVAPCAAAEGTSRTISKALLERDIGAAKDQIRYSRLMVGPGLARSSNADLFSLLGRLEGVWEDEEQRAAAIAEIETLLARMCPEGVTAIGSNR